jgi:Phytase
VLAKTLVWIRGHFAPHERPARRLRWPRLLVATLWLGFGGAPAVAQQFGNIDVSPLDFEVDGPGSNIDDPCFWVDQANPANSLLFVTAKDSGLVEVFRASTGAFVTSITGFNIPNNYVAEGDLLLTTDSASPVAVRVQC